MSRLLLTMLAVCVLVTGVTQTGPGVYAQERAGAANPFLTLGTIGPDAIAFRLWTIPSRDAPFKAGDRVTVHFKAEKPCYLVVANVAPTGDVQILFPYKDKDVTNNRMDAGKEYTLFEEGSRLRLTIHKKTPKTNLVFYVSPKPVDFVKIDGDQIVMKVPVDNKEAQEALREQIEKMAAQKGFNRQVLAIDTERDQSKPPEVVTGAKGWKDGSDTPEAVTGAAGWKDESETPEAVAGAAGRSETPRVK